ncbi:MAG: hypothetical protein HZB35_03155 [Nitrospirae bacterium]|nr:hypothetical protein [Nitrospirota bacterium]
MIENEDNTISELLADITTMIGDFPKALKRRAALVQATGKDPDLVGKLINAADTMRDSGNLYITWARHFAALAEGNTDARSDEDETEDFDV